METDGPGESLLCSIGLPWGWEAWVTRRTPPPGSEKGGLQAWCGPAPSILSGWGRPAGLLSWSVKGAHLSLTDQNLHVDASVNGSSLHNMSVMLSERERAR